MPPRYIPVGNTVLAEWETDEDEDRMIALLQSRVVDALVLVGGAKGGGGGRKGERG